ncbi:85 kDa calcium-independent phospholipase A2-like protein [Sarcoptes scabiei]|uniref:phospholipase A2 n=1 Tax=Sarcoptes scabiei TaxID=52283 RepID=A0A131ZXG4_SARSC|nr:85 kDa calcium-independent phospholipase A2-like protein [Sarcoptes scabiei]
MFNIFYRTFISKPKTNLFEDSFEVYDIDQIVHKARVTIRKDGEVFLYTNKAEINKTMIDYYEIVYGKENIYSFMIYHSISRTIAEEYYENFAQVLNNLNKSISIVKVTAFDQLKAIMSCLKINPKWTSTHVAARVGFEIHFKESKQIAREEINKQFDDDRLTPLHLAINQRWLSLVRLILDHLEPNLDLLDSKEYSCLHHAALSTFEIFCLILYQPKMFDRIQWRNHQGSTALHLACFAENYQVVLQFLRFGLTVRMLSLSTPKRSARRAISRLRRRSSSRIRHNNPNDPFDQVVVFTEQDLSDLDCKDIGLGGSPLHWVLHRRLMDKLIAHKFRLDLVNIKGDTPLHVMTQRNRLLCVISLLCAGANINAKNKFGNTPLHHAIKSDEIYLARTLIVFDADLNAVNKINESVRHLAAKEPTASQQVILYSLSSLGALRCPEGMVDCNPGCSFDGNFEGRCSSALYELTETFESFFGNFKNSTLFQSEMNRNANDEEKKRSINLLALDGGGIKGLIIVQVLIELQKHLDRPIIDYFQWIAGTSTGSFIAVFLTLGKTLQEIRSIYFQFKDKVFVGDRPYDAEPLENLVKEILGPELKMSDLKTKYGKNVIIPAVLYDRMPMKLHLFRSYQSHLELLKKNDSDPGFQAHPSSEQLVWKACRASSAAPTYFKSFGPFIDGGMLSNNPTLDALAEFEFHKNALIEIGRSDQCKQVRFVLSLGTGRQPIEESKTIDISAFSINLMDLNNQIRYIYQMVILMLLEICNTDNHIINRQSSFLKISFE